MKKLILFMCAFIFAVPVFAIYPMDGQAHVVNGGDGIIEFNLPTIRNGTDVEVKPFACDVTTNYKSNVNGFAVEYYVIVQNAILYRPTNIYNNHLYIDKGITYIAKSSGGKVMDIYQTAFFYIENNGCSPYDPDCHKTDPYDDALTVSCRVLR